MKEDIPAHKTKKVPKDCRVCLHLVSYGPEGVNCIPLDWILSNTSRIVPKPCKCSHFALDKEKTESVCSA